MVSPCTASRPRPTPILAGFILLALIPAARGQAPAKPPARLVPAEGLSAYLEYDGLDAHADAWKATTAHAILRDTPAGTTVAQVVQQLVDRALKETPGAELTGGDVVALHDHLLAHGFAVALYDEGEDQESAVFVLRGLGRKEARERFGRALRQMLGKEAAALKPTTIRGRAIYQLKHEPKPAADADAAAPGPVPPGAINALPPEPVAAPVYAANVLPAGVPVGAPPEALALAPRVDLPSVAPAAAPRAASPNAPQPAPAPPAEAVGAAPAPLRLVPAPAAAAGEAPPRVMPAPAAAAGEAPAPVTPPTLSFGVVARPAAAERPSADSWWFEGDDLIVVSGPSGEAAAKPNGDAKKAAPAPRKDRLAAVLDAIEGKRPDITTHPGYAAATAEGRSIAGFEPDGLFFVEIDTARGGILQAIQKDSPLPGLPTVAGLPGLSVVSGLPGLSGLPLPTIVPKPGGDDPAKALGLDGIKRLVGRWGFQGKGLMTAVRLEAPAPRKGVVGLLDGPTFRKDRLPAIPRGAGAIVVGSLDPVGQIDAMVALAKSVDPDAAKGVDAAIKEGERIARAATGVRVREDLLGRLRTSWCVYAAPGGWDGKKPEEAAPVVILGVDDADALGKALDTLATRGNVVLRGLEGLGENPAEPPAIALERLPAPERGYRLTSPSGLVPWLNGTVEPTLALGKSSVVLAANPAQARAAIAAESGTGPRWTPAGELARSIECLPTDLTFLWIGNPSDSSWPETLAGFPAIVQYLGNLADYATQGGGDGTSEVRALLGIPRPGGFRLRIDRSKLADSADIQARLFPSVLAASVDDRGLRILSREALPFGCFGTDTDFKIKLGSGMNWGDALKFSVRYGPGK